MYQYLVWYDFKSGEVWEYNQVYTTELKSKGMHKSAEREAKEWLDSIPEYDKYRITRVDCD